MQGYHRLNDATNQAWPDTLSAALEIGDEGLGARTVLVRMVGSTGSRRLALNTDSERLNAMLSVAFRRQEWSSVFHHVKEASDHWQRGDKALANLRLVFAGLPRLSDSADAHRLQLAEYLLDEGMPPDALMKELGFAPERAKVDKYSPDQPRVPAGNGRRSGEWDFRDKRPSDAGSPRIVVAIESDPPGDKNDLDGPAHHPREGQLPEDEHGFQLNLLAGLPGPGGRPVPIGGEAAPPLQRIHPDSTYESGVAKNSLDFIRKQSTEDIVRSLAQDSKSPLVVEPDGRIYNGNTRIKVLQERGYDINSLPRTNR